MLNAAMATQTHQTASADRRESSDVVSSQTNQPTAVKPPSRRMSERRIHNRASHQQHGAACIHRLTRSHKILQTSQCSESKTIFNANSSIDFALGCTKKHFRC